MVEADPTDDVEGDDAVVKTQKKSTPGEVFLHPLCYGFCILLLIHAIRQA